MSKLSIGINSQGINNINSPKKTNVSNNEQASQQEQAKQVESKQVNINDVYAYMSNNPATIAALNNINFTAQTNKEVGKAVSNTILSNDVASYIAAEALLAAAYEKLSPEQIASIEASMGKFQEGVVSYAPLVEEELGATASEETVLAVAAGMLLDKNE